MGKSDRLVIGFTLLYVLASAPYAYASKNSEFIFYIGVLVLLIGLVGWVHRKVHLHIACLWMLSAWGLAHMAGGLVHVSDEVGVLYSLWLIPDLLKYDQLVHAFGFGVSTWVVWQGLRANLTDARPTLGMLFICACAGLGLGALNEIVEFLAVLTIPDTNVGGYTNTGWDLVANLVGATLAAIAIRLGHRA